MAEPNITPTPATEPEPTPGNGGEKTFTQAEVDALIGKRIAKAMKGMPTEEELNAFRSWKESQQTEQDKWNNLTKERDTARNELSTAQAELEQLKRENYLTGKGVPADDLDYYVFKIGKLVTDSKTFEQAAEDFLKDNSPNKVRIDMTAPLDRRKPAATTANDAMNALIRGAFK